MKTKVSLLGIVATLLIGVSTFFVACQDELDAVVTYIGKVVYKDTTKPFPDLVVKITDGKNIHSQTFTDENGAFSIEVKLNEIDKNYYLLAGDSTCEPRRVELKAFGQKEFDLGVIEVEGPSLPIVTTYTKVYDISDTQASCGGNVISDGRLAVTARGVCWSSSEYPTIEDAHTTNGTGTGEFKSQMTGLKAGQSYYVRAYATNKLGTAYGESIPFKATTGLPEVTTDEEVTNVTSSSATCGGYVAENSGYTITARGLCWSSTTATPTINDTRTQEVANTGHFTSTMIGLNRTTTYYVRAYAENERGVNYGETRSFTTTDGKPQVETGRHSNITGVSAKVSGNVKSAGDYPVTACGICWSNTSSTPTTSGSHTSEVARVGEFTSTLTGLTKNTTYYYRAYATNQLGTVYGETDHFTTAATTDGLPVVQTIDPGENITDNSITTGANVTNDGGSSIQECGVVYSTSPNPTLANASKKVAGYGTGYYTTTIYRVTPYENTYYIRAYATNANGTAYGEQITTTPDYISLKKMEYGGYTYRIKFMGKMTWDDGKAACENLVISGYDDWYMPNNAEVQAILEAYGVWGILKSYTSDLKVDNCNEIWGETYNSSNAYYYAIIWSSTSGAYRWINNSYTSKSSIKGVYAVRKYRPGESGGQGGSQGGDQGGGQGSDQASYYIKHSWGSGADDDWLWQKMTEQSSGVYVYDGLWGGVGANINTKANDAGATWFSEDEISGASSLYIGDAVRFTYQSSSSTLSVTKTGSSQGGSQGNGNAQVRFQKQEAYTYVLAMSIEYFEDDQWVKTLAEHEFGTSSGTSSYYSIPAGQAYPMFYYSTEDESKWYMALDENYFNFVAGKKYTYTCGDDGTYLTFNIILDGSFNSPSRVVASKKIAKSQLATMQKLRKRKF